MIIVFVFAAALLLGGLLLVLETKTLLYITIIAIFFPIHIRFLGRDALTTGTLFIFVLYLKYLIEAYHSGKFIKEGYDILIYLLILLVGISLILPFFTGGLGQDQVGPAIRNYVGFLGAMLFMVVIKNFSYGKILCFPESYENQIEKFLTLFIILISMHILISIGIKYFPSIGPLFDIFLTRDVETFEIGEGGRSGITRIKSFVFSPESYGELLAALGPIILYKLFKFKNPGWIVCFFLISIGLINSVTRSSIILFLAGVIFSVLFHFKKYFAKIFVSASILAITFLFITFFYPAILADIFTRFSLATETYKATGSIISTINRDNVFLPAWDLVRSNPTVFGNGITPFHFHNLFLTTLYQKGAIGASIFFAVLLYPLVHLWKSINNGISANKALAFSCLISMALFLINECKYEFTRHGAYQQLWQVLIGTYYLVSKNLGQKRSIK